VATVGLCLIFCLAVASLSGCGGGGGSEVVVASVTLPTSTRILGKVESSILIPESETCPSCNNERTCAPNMGCGCPMPGVTVTWTWGDNGKVVATTNECGKYQFNNIPTETDISYELTKDGYISSKYQWLFSAKSVAENNGITTVGNSICPNQW
jgi:hypothetical protein